MGHSLMVIDVRKSATGDAAAMRAIYAPYVLGSAISFEEDVPSEEDMESRRKAAHVALVAENRGIIVGYAYGGVHRARPAYRFACDVSVYVDDRHHRQGIGRVLFQALLPELAQSGFHRAYGGIALPNDGSVALHEAFGFRHIGTFDEVGFKFGRWHDVGWWEKRL